MDFDHLEQVKALADAPMAPPATPKGSAWGAIKAAGRGVVAAGAEVFSQLQSLDATRGMDERGDPNDPINVERRRSEQKRAEYAQRAEDYARSLRPDPATAGTAEQVLFGLSKGLTKAVTAVATMGPAAGAVAFGGSEAASTFTDLRHEGVDSGTAGQAAAVSGVLNAAGVLLPMAGQTLKATAALYLAGGPGGYMAQQALTREVLSRAGYDEIAKKYDPLDPVGLPFALLFPLPFAAHGALRNVRASKGGAAPAVTQEAVDAAMVHNLTLQQERAAPVSAVPDISHPHLQRLPEQNRQTMVAMYQQAERVKPAFDHAMSSLADEVGGTAKLADLKGTDRATAKIVSDYGGDPTKIKDLVRGTIEVDSASGAQQAVASIFERFEVAPTGRRNLLDPAVQPVDGYRDAKFNVVVDGHVAEVQVNLPEMLAAKKKAHVYYEERSAMERAWAGKPMPADEIARYDGLNATMRAIYEPAWAAALARDAATSAPNSAARLGPSSGAPLRLADAGSNTRGGSVSQAIENGTPGASGLSDTGTPSTSNNSALGPKAGSSIATSGDIVPPGGPVGGVATVLTERGMATDVRYRAVDAAELVTSHNNDLAANPAFPQELQPRDRSRSASADQIARIENGLRPELLGDSVKASDGAPIVGPDLVVESGNARTIALRRAYGSGKAEAYRGWLTENAQRFGLQRDQIAAMQRPVLVRERIGNVDRAEFARQANESAVAAMSPAEQAKADASRLNDLSGLVANEDGTINMARSGDLVRQFVQHVIAPTERGAMLQADGRLSQAGQLRLRNAIFSRAYGDPSLVQMLAESTDGTLRNVLAGLMRAAPEMARLRDLAAAGARQPIDVAGDVAAAVKQLAQLKADGMTVEQYLSQGSLLGDGLPPQVQNLLVGLSENARAPKRIAEMLRGMVDTVDAMGDPRQAGMFGDAPASASDVTANAVERLRSLTDDQIKGVETALPAPSADPVLQQTAARVQELEATAGDMLMRVEPDGTRATLADDLAAVRKEAAEGTDAELGALDADLVRVAAECAMSMGA